MGFSFPGILGGAGELLFGTAGSPRTATNPFAEVDPTGALRGQANAAGASADQFGLNQAGARNQMLGAANLLGQRARGENLVSTVALKQGLGQNLAQQQALAAQARSPADQARAASQASRQAANLGAGLSGQAALAGAHEANQALGGLGGLLGNIRQGDLQGLLGSRGQALQGFGNLEAARTARFGAVQQSPTSGEAILGGAASLLPMAGGGGN